jgi:hypothetical protein
MEAINAMLRSASGARPAAAAPRGLGLPLASAPQVAAAAAGVPIVRTALVAAVRVGARAETAQDGLRSVAELAARARDVRLPAQIASVATSRPLMHYLSLNPTGAAPAQPVPAAC